MEKALIQTFVRELGMGAEQAGEAASGIMDGAYDQAGIEELLGPVKNLLKEAVSGVEDLEQETRQSLRTTQATPPPPANIPLPDVTTIEMPNADPLSSDRLALDEQLFGRPSRLG